MRRPRDMLPARVSGSPDGFLGLGLAGLGQWPAAGLTGSV
jgi:hypothetical protein